MTAEMAFECVLVCNHPVVFGTMARILRELSISIEICLRASSALEVIKRGSTDLVIIDWDGPTSSELIEEVWKLRTQKKPVIVVIADSDSKIAGAHLLLHKPLHPERTSRTIKEAYSRMLLEYRRHVRHALMQPVIATRQDGEEFPMTVADIGDQGVGLCAKVPLVEGDIVSFCLSLPNASRDVFIQARVLWARDYGRFGCEFVRIPPVDLIVLHEWLRSKCQVKPPQTSLASLSA